MKQGDCHCSLGLTSLPRIYAILYRARQPSLGFPCCYYVIHLSIFNEDFFNMWKNFFSYLIPSKQVPGVLPLKYTWNDFSSPSTFTPTTLAQAIVLISPLDYCNNLFVGLPASTLPLLLSPTLSLLTALARVLVQKLQIMLFMIRTSMQLFFPI